MKDIYKDLYFVRTDNGYMLRLANFTDNADIPSKYRGLPVTEIGSNAFFLSNCLSVVNIPEGIEKIGVDAFAFCDLKSVILPYSLKKIEAGAFSSCRELEQVIFLGNNVVFDCDVFRKCPKLAAENVMQGLALSCDITKPFIENETYSGKKKMSLFDWDSALRNDVFALALKYDSFALFDKGKVLKEITERNLSHLLPLTENAGWNITEECIGELLELSAQKGSVEITAWLLEYKNRNFGFNNNSLEDL